MLAHWTCLCYRFSKTTMDQRTEPNKVPAQHRCLFDSLVYFSVRLKIFCDAQSSKEMHLHGRGGRGGCGVTLNATFSASFCHDITLSHSPSSRQVAVLLSTTQHTVVFIYSQCRCLSFCILLNIFSRSEDCSSFLVLSHHKGADVNTENIETCLFNRKELVIP